MYETEIIKPRQHGEAIRHGKGTLSPQYDIMYMKSRLYVAEHNAINSLAHHGRAIFVGHCASEVLKGKDGILRVFVRANDAFKTKRMITEYGIADKDVEAECRRYNKKRANYYVFITSRKWDDLSNYDMVLDSSRIGIDGCAAAIAALL